MVSRSSVACTFQVVFRHSPGWVWWDNLVSLRRWKQEDLRLKASLGYIPNSKPV